MCGEKVLKVSPAEPLRGSPPHVRGKANPAISLICSRGITPACAGKSEVNTPFFINE